MLVLDLDGTVVQQQGQVGRRTLAAVHAAQNAGLLLVVATGRRLRNALPYLRLLGADGPNIFCNGAVTVDLGSWRTMAYEPLGASGTETAAEWLSLGLNPLVCSYTLRGADVACAAPVTTGPEWLMRGVRYGEIAPVEDVAAIAGAGLKLMAVVPQPDLPAALSALAPGHCMTTVDEGGVTLLEFWRNDVSKAAAVHRLARAAGISRAEIIAFGDNTNDVELLEYAGLGVAMGNAVPEAVRAASFVTGGCADDGVADVLEMLGFHARVA